MMSDHLEQVVQATGPGKILVTTSIPVAPASGIGKTSGLEVQSALRKLEFFKLEEKEWASIYRTTVDGGPEPEQVVMDVETAGLIRCKLTNMSGREGQFSLDCSFEPGGLK